MLPNPQRLKKEKDENSLGNFLKCSNSFKSTLHLLNHWRRTVHLHKVPEKYYFKEENHG